MIKEIPITELTIGMYVVPMSNAWIPDSNSRKEGVIRAETTITRIKSMGTKTLSIDTKKGLDCQTTTPVAQGFDQAIGVAAQVRASAKHLVGNLLNSAKAGTVLDMEGVAQAGLKIAAALQANCDTMICMGRLRNKDSYLLEHSVNVATLLGVFAMIMGHNENTQLELISGGLLHDIGKIQVPNEILNKPGKLDASEWTEMQRHVEYGQKTLANTEGISPLVMSICGLHHERLDGSGYPLGLGPEEISVYGRMASIVDVYDAITADRAYHQGMTPTEGMRKLVEWSGCHLDKELVYHFIRALSIYPSGSVVELDNGLVGFVSSPNLNRPDRPVVDVFFSARERKPVTKDRIDLSYGPETTKIVRPVDEKTLGIRLDDIILPAN